MASLSKIKTKLFFWIFFRGGGAWKLPVRLNLSIKIHLLTLFAQWLKCRYYMELVPLRKQGSPQPLDKTLALRGTLRVWGNFLKNLFSRSTLLHSEDLHRVAPLSVCCSVSDPLLIGCEKLRDKFLVF